MKTPSQTLSLTVRRSSSLFPPIHAIRLIDLSLFLNPLLFSAPMSCASLCLSQPQRLPFRHCCPLRCPSPSLRIRDAPASSSKSLIFLHFPPFLSLSPCPKSHSLFPMEAVLRSAARSISQENLPFPTNLCPSPFIFSLPPRCLILCLVSRP